MEGEMGLRRLKGKGREIVLKKPPQAINHQGLVSPY